MGAFEVGNAAATLMILRATELLTPTRGVDSAAEIAVLLYVGYNVAATLASLPGGHVSDRLGSVHALIVGAGSFLVAYMILATAGPGIGVLLLAFALAGVGIGFAETAEASAVASMSDESVRGSAFGLLAALQSLGNFLASAIAGLLWTLASPSIAFVWLAAWMVLAGAVFLSVRRGTASPAS
jgi:MFS family permease